MLQGKRKIARREKWVISRLMFGRSSAGRTLVKVRRGDVAGPVNLKDCHWNMKPLPHAIYEATLLPAGVVCAPESDQDVVRFESTHGVRKGCHRRVSVDFSLTGRTHRVQVSQHRAQALVGFVSGTVDVRYQPLERARQSWGNDKTLGSSFDQESNNGRKCVDINGNSSGCDQQPQRRQRCHEMSSRRVFDH
jgi:hypothetical protein